jgi:hypothetical protein
MIILTAKASGDSLMPLILKNIKMQIKNVFSKISRQIVNLYYRVFF